MWSKDRAIECKRCEERVPDYTVEWLAVDGPKLEPYCENCAWQITKPVDD